MVTVDVAPAAIATRLKPLSCLLGRGTAEPGYFTYNSTTSSPARVLELVTSTLTLIEAWHRLSALVVRFA